MRLTALLSLALGAALCSAGVTVAAPAVGPLRVCPDNPRYFAGPDGRAIYLTGAHTWNNLQDFGDTNPPPPFDWEEYLRFLERHNLNFVRLWRQELSRWVEKDPPHEVRFCAPMPWMRTGPGLALDGKPKFDLNRFDPDYFRRLHDRVSSAGSHGIYVSVMLFEGWSLQFAPAAWRGHPFNAANNINGINADTNGDGKGLECLTIGKDPMGRRVLRLQEAYVRKVIDTVGDLDNVLYEISNESGPASTVWQYHMIQFIQDTEKTRPKQHPVGMTFQYQGGSNAALFASPADWISPNGEGGYNSSPPANNGRKVILSDTDHLWGLGGTPAWVWKRITRGLNPIFMDPYQEGPGKPPALEWEPVRKNLGYARGYALRMDLNHAAPVAKLASSGFCLAVRGKTYLVFAPTGSVEVHLDAIAGHFRVEWLNPASGQVTIGDSVAGGVARDLTAPFKGEAVLFLSHL